MPRDPRYDILFEPVKIGPVTAPNRFYQVPHCTGMGWQRPRMLAAMRGDQGRGRLGRRLHRIQLDPPDVRRPAPRVGVAVGRQRRSRTPADDRRGARARGAGRRGALVRRRASRRTSITRHVSMDVDSLPNLAGHPFQTRAMDKRTSATFAAGIAMPRCGRGTRVSTSSMSTRPTAICCPTSSSAR